MLHSLPKSILGGSSTRQQRRVGLDLLRQGHLSLLGGVQRLRHRGQLQLEIRVGVLGGAELLAPLSEKTLQLTMGGSILLALTLERDKLLAALLDIGLQLRHLCLQLFLGGPASARDPRWSPWRR